MAYLEDHLDDIEIHKVCCRHEPSVAHDSLIVNACASCDRRFPLHEGVRTVSLWEVIDDTGGFPFPDYGGMLVTVHDACQTRTKKQVHSAIRSLLEKMNISVVEAEHHGTQAICCGDSFYPHLPLEQVHSKMKMRAESMPCEDVVVYCVSCIKSMSIGGKKPRHILDLLLGETTEPEITDVVRWYEQLQTYIDTHSRDITSLRSSFRPFRKT